MRKFSKITLIIAGVAGAVGLGLTIGGTAMGATVAGLNFRKENWGQMLHSVVTQHVTFRDDGAWEEDWDELQKLQPSKSTDDSVIYQTDTASSLHILLSTDQLAFSEYDGKEICIEVTGNKKDKVRVGQEGDELVIEGIGRVKDRNITVKYPRGYLFEDVSANVAAGTVQICNDFAADDMEISMAAGEFTNSGSLTANDLEISVGTGNAEFKNLEIQNLEGECGVGNIELHMNRTEKDYNYEISCGAGSVEIGDSSYEGIGNEKKISNPGAEGTMKLECGIGTITVDFAE